ncbi:MAG: hypothetical protein FJ303_22815 [Planctomycetes bacterium]|nr:hypothetical protein [Planctomycetota bacterium]
MRILFVCAIAFFASSPVHAQKAPEAGYVFPAGGKAGTAVDVKLGGYDWTPDTEYLAHDKRVQLVANGPPGPILIAPPPYWFGAKGRIGSLPLPRETLAKFVIPADMPPGPIYWQAVNANGASEPRVFIVGTGIEVVEDENRTGAQSLQTLPVAVSGRLFKNEEVDRYRFVTPKDGPVTCELTARRIGSKFHGILEVHDAQGKLVRDALGTSGDDPALTFPAKANAEYIVSVRDVDFGGDRSYVYRLAITPGPRIVGAIPAAGERTESREVEFVLDTGAAKFDSIKRTIAFSAVGRAFDAKIGTPLGTTPPFTLPISDHAEIVVGAARPAGPVGITGVLDQPDAEHRHAFDWKKGEAWSLAAEARRIGSPLDVSVAIVGPDGKELARNDDAPGTTDAALTFLVPADGTYTVVVSDTAGRTGTRAAIYRLAVRSVSPDFTLQVPAQKARVHVGDKIELIVTALRTGGFNGPIALSIKGLPAGVTAPADLVIPAGKPSLSIPLQAAKDAGTLAGLVTLEGTGDLASTGTGLFSRNGPAASPATTVTRLATARTTVNLAPRSPDDGLVTTLCLATTLKPRFKGQPVDQDTGRKVHRGSTHPAEVILERLEGYGGDIVLQMASRQSYQMQGITGGEVIVPPGVTKTIYPVFMPEWLETTRTSRCGMIAVAKLADPKGKVRWICNDITGFITMTMEGALLKVSADEPDMTVPAGQPFDVRLKISRLTKLNGMVRLELRAPDVIVGQLKAEPMTLGGKDEQVVMRVTPTPMLRGLHTFTVRGTAMQDGKYLVLSEASVVVELK